jgi:tartrate dehydrogenase/decarboxylase / D-malate dehydrogenase
MSKSHRIAVIPGDGIGVVHENTEGEYSSIGGKIFEGTDRETVVQETVMTRTGVDRILKYAFDLAQSRPRKHLTSATKSNRHRHHHALLGRTRPGNGQGLQ